MRKLVKHKHQEETEINLTPMLDVVFIMLIFFIVTTSFVKESGISVNRPSAKTTEQKTSANIIIAISENNEIWIDKSLVDIRSLRSNIERMKATNTLNSVVVESDKLANTGILINVMDQIRLAGITNISVSTRIKD